MLRTGALGSVDYHALSVQFLLSPHLNTVSRTISTIPLYLEIVDFSLKRRPPNFSQLS